MNRLLILLVLLTVIYQFSGYAEDAAQNGLPEGAIARLGKGGINLIRFSPNGSKLAVGTDIGLWLYDVVEGPLSGKFFGGFNQVNVLAFSSDGSMLASGGINNPELGIMTTDNSQKYSSYNISEDSIILLGITFHDNSIISLNYTSALIHYNTYGEKKSKLPLQSKYELAVFSHDASTLAAVDEVGEIQILDSLTGKSKGLLIGHEDIRKRDISALAFSPEGRMLASGSDDKTVILWDIEKKKQIITLKGHKGKITAIAFSENGKTLATGDEVKEIRIWDLDKYKLRTTITDLNDSVMSLAFSQFTTPEYGMCVVSGTADGVIQFWDPINGMEMTTFSTGYIDRVESVSFSNDSTLLSTTFNNIENLWNLNSYEVQSTIRKEQFTIQKGISANNLVLSPDGNIVTVTGHTSITGHHVSTGTKLFDLTAGTAILAAGKPVFSPDGKWLAFGGSFSDTYIWKVESPEEPPITLPRKMGTLVFSHDSKMLALVDWDGIYLWDFKAKNTDLITITTEKMSIVNCILAFSPDGTMLVESPKTMENSFRIWDVKSGKKLELFIGHTESINTLVYSHEGKILASGSDDGTVLLWDWEKIVSRIKVGK